MLTSLLTAGNEKFPTKKNFPCLSEGFVVEFLYNSVGKGEKITEKLAKRPFFTVCSVWLAVSFPLFFTVTAVRLAVLIISAVLFAALLTARFIKSGRYRNDVMPYLLIALGMFLSGIFQFVHCDIAVPRILSYSGTDPEITATVIKCRQRADYGSSYDIKLTSANGKRVSFPAVLHVPGELDAEPGETIRANVSFSRPEESENGFPLRRYYISKGIYLIAEAEPDGVEFTGKTKTVGMFFASLSDRLSARLKLSLGGDTGGFASGILLGRRGDVPDGLQCDFRYLGISHILAVSGMHLSVIAGAFIMLLRFFRLKRGAVFALGSAFTVFMMLLVGLPASVVRSGIMLIICLAADAAGKVDTPVISLVTAGTAIVLFSPESLADAGFQLSFSATLGILTLGKYLVGKIMGRLGKKKLVTASGEKKSNPLRPLASVLSLLAVSLSAVIFTLPFSWFCYREISAVSPLSNLIFIPLAEVFLFLSSGVLIFTGGLPGYLFRSGAGAVGLIITNLAGRLARISPEPVFLGQEYALPALMLAVIAGVVFCAVRKKVGRSVIIVIFAAWVGLFSVCRAVGAVTERETVKISAFNRGKNDYLLVNSGSKTLLIDFSDGRTTGLRNAASSAADLFGDVSADAVLLTHLHRYHAVSLARLSESTRLDYIILPEPYDEASGGAAAAIKEAAEKRGVTVISYPSDRKSSIDFKNCRITLSGISFLKRSVQPVMYLTVDTGNGIFGYFSASVFSSSLSYQAKEAVAGCDTAWLGIHGPVIKESPGTLTSGGNVVVSSDEVNTAYGTVFEPVDGNHVYVFRKNTGE